MKQLLQTIAAFVYCNRQGPPAGATRPPAAGERLNAPLNSAHCPKLLWPPYVIGQAIIFLPCGFFLPSFSFYSSPNLSGHRLDVYHK